MGVDSISLVPMTCPATSAQEILLIFPPLNPMIRHPEIGLPQLLGWLRRQGARAGMVDLNAAFLRGWMRRDDVLDELLVALSPQTRGRLAEELRVLRFRADALAARLPDGPGVRGGRPASRKVMDHLYRVVALPLADEGEHPDPGPQALGVILRASAAERDLAVLAEDRLARMIHDDLLGPDGWTPGNLMAALSRPSALFDWFLDVWLAPRIPDEMRVVAVSVHGSPHLAPALRIAAWLKARRPDLAVIFGGPWCMAAEDVISGDLGFFDHVDGVCTGEGEGPLIALVEALRSRQGVNSVSGFLVRDGAAVRSTGASLQIPLDAVGPPDYSDVDWDLHPERTVAFRTVRGCTWSRCLFCYHVLNDKPGCPSDPGFTEIQARDLRDLVRWAVDSGRVETLVLADNATPPGVLDAVAAALGGEDAPLPWESMARVDPGINQDRAARWSRSGCSALSFGLETSDPEELKRLGKGITLDVAEASLAACRAAGIATRVFALDYPSQPPGAYEDTLEWLLARSADVSDPIPLRFALGRGSGAYRAPEAMGIRLRADHPNWYNVFDVPFDAPEWRGPEPFREATEEAMVKFEQRRHEARSGRDLLLFLPFAVSDFKDKGFFAYPACYHLEAALRVEPGMIEAWEIEALPFRPSTSGPMAHGDRLWERIFYQIQSRSPRAVAFSLYGWSLAPSLRLARALRAAAPGILILAGGPEIADREELALRWDAFDVLIEGDGEVPLSAVLRPEQVITELETILGSESVRSIVFFDYDLLSIYQDDLDTIRRILAVLQTRPEVAVQFFTSPGNLGRPELAELVESLRISRIMVGIQSMSPAALRAVNRGWAVSQLDDLDAPPPDLRRHVVIELVYPLPEETPETFFGGLDRLVRMGYGRFQVFPLVVLRGTALRREATRWGLQFMEDPPSYALETASFPAAAMREARGVAWILSLLNEFNGTEPDDVDALDTYVRATPGLIGELRARVRDGAPLDRILGDVMDAIHGETFVGADAVDDFLVIAGRDEILAQRVPSSGGDEAPRAVEVGVATRRDAFPPAACLP